MRAKSKELLDARGLSEEKRKELERPAPPPPTPEEEAISDAEDEKEQLEAKKKASSFPVQRKNTKESYFDSKKGSAGRTFRKDVGKSPTEYGDSTATPGEAEKDTIEYPPGEKPKQ
ncbi:MAG: hypothetical protein KGP28_00765 [Bdellovibrionales bacterium]|nr:hypothetical protein [Bdellovibrionales bacterium]